VLLEEVDLFGPVEISCLDVLFFVLFLFDQAGFCSLIQLAGAGSVMQFSCDWVYAALAKSDDAIIDGLFKDADETWLHI